MLCENTILMSTAVCNVRCGIVVFWKANGYVYIFRTLCADKKERANQTRHHVPTATCPLRFHRKYHAGVSHKNSSTIIVQIGSNTGAVADEPPRPSEGNARHGDGRRVYPTRDFICTSLRATPTTAFNAPIPPPPHDPNIPARKPLSTREGSPNLGWAAPFLPLLPTQLHPQPQLDPKGEMAPKKHETCAPSQIKHAEEASADETFFLDFPIHPRMRRQQK